MASGMFVQKSEESVGSVTIASGQSLSPAIDLGNTRLVGIVTPATFEPTALTFQASVDGSNFFNVYDSTGTEKSITVSTSRFIILSPSDFYGIRYLKIRGGTSGTPTTVAANRTLSVTAEA